MRVVRKVKLDGKWVFAPVPLDRGGRPDAKHVLRKGELVAVDGGTFYIVSGRHRTRRHVACGDDPESVRRALKTQQHVVELRARGMEVGDAPEIVANRRNAGATLREMAKAFRDEPPTGFTVKTRAKYINALETFATWASSTGVAGTGEVTKRTIARWIAHLQNSGLDAGTIIPKVRIVLAELKERGNEIQLDGRKLLFLVSG